MWYTVIPRKLVVPNSRNFLTCGSSRCSIPPNSLYLYLAPKFAIWLFSKPQKSRVWRNYCITKECRTSNALELAKVNQKAAIIARKERLETKMEVFTLGNTRATFKDTKQGFLGKLSWRLLNPAKTPIGKLSQVILKEKVSELRDKLQLNHWKSTQEVLEWFKTLDHKKQVTKNQPIKFIKFDIQAYYPSITRELLDTSIQFARENGIFICESDKEIVLTARDSFLFNNGLPYVKRNRNDRFDVPRVLGTVPKWPSYVNIPTAQTY